ncbi:UbiA-like polyprenyltransferase [Solitalea lacus]|uniref:UbiA-like polyprenyltransferase n=1 Tax=Solitalea lacus TaxID=2911172 RepID=UPI001EDA42AA|nr:UbiA-like polyprenyltransferase [Solitalea lacus]UKJ08855.1 putative 4-hydroxybenzoate polyprenyltransferase [Solitalea lacus]
MKNYLSLIKFSHTIFAMPFAVIGFVLAVSSTGAAFELKKFILMIACMVFARSAAMAFNRFIDREFDAKNPRTKVREIPAGIISPQKAMLFTLFNCAAFITTTYFINSICFYLSPIALLVVLGYSYTKRFTSFCHLVLGLGLSLAPIGAYLVVTGEFALLPILFSLAVITWVSGFDIIYALQDEDFDRSQQLHSIPEWLGTRKALNFSSILHLLSALFVIAAGWLGLFGLFYWIGVAGYIGMLIYQHSIVKPNDLSRVNLAFMTANGIASVCFAVFFLADTYIKF